jgi:DNA-binding transcriptional LysR family regulator
VELRHLRYFVAVAEERSFLRAAERLHISQPPLSTQVKDLEEELGVLLLQRSSKGIQLTPAGEVFYGEARAVLARVEHARVAARRASRGEEGRLSIGFISVVDYSFLPAALKSFRDRYPGVEVQLHELTTDAQVQELVAERLDVGIGIAPVEHEQLAFRRVVSERLVLAAPSALLPSAPRPVSLKAFAGQPFVMIPREMAPGYYDAFAALCRACGFQPNIAQRAKQMQTVISLVSNAFGVALVPESLMNLQRTGVAYAPVRERGPSIDIGLLHRRKDANPAIELFARIVQETLAGGDGAGTVVRERPPAPSRKRAAKRVRMSR